MTSFWCLYCYLPIDFTHCSVSIADFEQVNADKDFLLWRLLPTMEPYTKGPRYTLQYAINEATCTIKMHK